LFSQNNRGIEDNAIFYSFIVPCQCLDKNPYHWLKVTFELLRPNMEDDEMIKQLSYNNKIKRLETKNQVAFLYHCWLN